MLYGGHIRSPLDRFYADLSTVVKIQGTRNAKNASRDPSLEIVTPFRGRGLNAAIWIISAIFNAYFNPLITHVTRDRARAHIFPSVCATPAGKHDHGVSREDNFNHSTSTSLGIRRWTDRAVAVLDWLTGHCISYFISILRHCLVIHRRLSRFDAYGGITVDNNGSWLSWNQ